MRKSIFTEHKRYTFSDYFNFANPTEEIIAELGYTLCFETIDFTSDKPIDNIIVNKLQDFYYQLLPKISTNSEIAKREFMIAPVLHEIMLNVDAKLSVEYPIDINEKLNGVLNYFIQAKQQIVVIEAKKSDLDRGFNQLAAEMIALDQYEQDTTPTMIYGAITIGEVWRFAILNRQQKQSTKDINLFRFPQDTQDIVSILLGILK